MRFVETLRNWFFRSRTEGMEQSTFEILEMTHKLKGTNNNILIRRKKDWAYWAEKFFMSERSAWALTGAAITTGAFLGKYSLLILVPFIGWIVLGMFVNSRREKAEFQHNMGEDIGFYEYWRLR